MSPSEVKLWALANIYMTASEGMYRHRAFKRLTGRRGHGSNGTFDARYHFRVCTARKDPSPGLRDINRTWGMEGNGESNDRQWQIILGKLTGHSDEGVNSASK